MEILYFGAYHKNYSRNTNIIDGLKKNNIKVEECNFQGSFFFRYIKLTRCFLQKKDRVDTIIVGFSGHYDVWLAFLLAKIYKKRLIYDSFVTLYETYVIDRKLFGENSLTAYYCKVIDYLNFRLIDNFIVDSKAHLDMYKTIYGISSSKAITIYIGADTSVFKPKKTLKTNDILFYGSYQPLQGVYYIIKAAKLLPQYTFKLIGKGDSKSEIQELVKKMKLKNVFFEDWLSSEEICEEINKSKIVLGIFGNTSKALAVIPNKVYEALACKSAVITSKTPATEELLSAENVMFVEPANPSMTAKAIKSLMNDKSKRDKLAESGYNLFCNFLNTKVLVRNLIKNLK